MEGILFKKCLCSNEKKQYCVAMPLSAEERKRRRAMRMREYRREKREDAEWMAKEARRTRVSISPKIGWKLLIGYIYFLVLILVHSNAKYHFLNVRFVFLCMFPCIYQHTHGHKHTCMHGYTNTHTHTLIPTH
jgi:hypothetical protein